MRLNHLFLACTSLLILSPHLVAQETDLASEVKALKETVAQQTRQITALTQQIAKLTERLDARNGSAPTAASPSSPAGESEEFAVPGEPEPPKAEPADGLQRHVIVKGETLTSVAKHYNVPLSELMKVNKDVNDRKLQIGQTIRIPLKTGDPSSPQTAPDKKTNP